MEVNEFEEEVLKKMTVVLIEDYDLKTDEVNKLIELQRIWLKDGAGFWTLPIIEENNIRYSKSKLTEENAEFVAEEVVEDMEQHQNEYDLPVSL